MGGVFLRSPGAVRTFCTRRAVQAPNIIAGSVSLNGSMTRPEFCLTTNRQGGGGGRGCEDEDEVLLQISHVLSQTGFSDMMDTLTVDGKIRKPERLNPTPKPNREPETEKIANQTCIGNREGRIGNQETADSETGKRERASDALAFRTIVGLHRSLVMANPA